MIQNEVQELGTRSPQSTFTVRIFGSLRMISSTLRAISRSLPGSGPITRKATGKGVGTKYQLRRRILASGARPSGSRRAGTDARVALRQPAGDARGDRGRASLKEVTEVRHDLEDTRVEQLTVLSVGGTISRRRCHGVATGVLQRAPWPCACIDERRERARSRVPRAVRGGCARDRRDLSRRAESSVELGDEARDRRSMKRGPRRRTR